MIEGGGMHTGGVGGGGLGGAQPPRLPVTSGAPRAPSPVVAPAAASAHGGPTGDSFVSCAMLAHSYSRAKIE